MSTKTRSVIEKETEKEMREHPWAGKRTARRIAKDHILGKNDMPDTDFGLSDKEERVPRYRREYPKYHDRRPMRRNPRQRSYRYPYMPPSANQSSAARPAQKATPKSNPIADLVKRRKEDLEKRREAEAERKRQMQITNEKMRQDRIAQERAQAAEQLRRQETKRGLLQEAQENERRQIAQRMRAREASAAYSGLANAPRHEPKEPKIDQAALQSARDRQITGE